MTTLGRGIRELILNPLAGPEDGISDYYVEL